MLCLYWSLIEFWHLQQQSIHTVTSVRPVNLGKPWINSISYCVGLCSGVHMLNMPIQANFYHILYCLSIVNIIRIKNTDWMKRFMQMKLTPNHTQNLACLCVCVCLSCFVSLPLYRRWLTSDYFNSYSKTIAIQQQNKWVYSERSNIKLPL